MHKSVQIFYMLPFAANTLRRLYINILTSFSNLTYVITIVRYPAVAPIEQSGCFVWRRKRKCSSNNFPKSSVTLAAILKYKRRCRSVSVRAYTRTRHGNVLTRCTLTLRTAVLRSSGGKPPWPLGTESGSPQGYATTTPVATPQNQPNSTPRVAPFGHPSLFRSATNSWSIL